MTPDSMLQKRTLIYCRGSQLALNFEQAIVFCESFAPRKESSLDLSAAHRDREIGNKSVLGFARPMRYYVSPACVPTHLNSLDCFRHGADLV